MNRNRSRKLTSKQSSPISNISSHVPLMTTTKNNESYLLTQPLISSNVKADVHSHLQSSPMDSSQERKRSRTFSQPKGTITYIVENNDTIEKVALHFNSTPSELRQLNKLPTRMIFPGQTLFVPDQSSSNTSDQQQSTTSPSPTTSPSASTKPKEGDAFILLTDHRLSGELSPPSASSSHHQSQQDVGPMVWSMTRQMTARPGHVQRLKSSASIDCEPSSKPIEEYLSTQQEHNSNPVKTLQKSLTVDESDHLDEDCLQRFIKVNVRLMTEDRQSIAGTLLVTPNAVMFDPDVLDPLIKEHGIDKYGLIIRMDLLAGIALYEDLAMYEHAAAARDEDKRKACHSTSVKNFQNTEPNTSLKTDEEQIHDLMISLLDKIDKELNPSTSTDNCCMLFNASSTTQRHISKTSSNNNNEEEPFCSISTDEQSYDDSDQQLDDYKHSIEILHNDNKNKDENRNKNFNRIPSQGYHLENCVPLDQFNKRFGEIDKLLYKQQQNYFGSHHIEIPYYLCIKTSMHVHDIPSLYPKQYKKPSEKLTDNVYGKKQLEHEYWFSVPKDKIDHLHSFFLRWTPERQSDPLIDDEDENQALNINSSKYHDKTPKGFVLLANDDPELTSSTEQQNKKHYLQRQNTLLKEWEIISVDEIYRRINATQSNEYDAGIPPPKLLQQSTIINEEQAKQISVELPARVHGLDWHRTFSTETNGFSLNQLYRRSFELDRDSPSLLIIKDVEQNIFGAFIPHQLLISEGFYGTGESFLFTFYPEFRVFNWTHSNEFYAKGDIHSLGFGSGEGTYGLWIDGDLYHGRTCPSKTFNNEILTTNEDFIIASVEVWTFTD